MDPDDDDDDVLIDDSEFRTPLYGPDDLEPEATETEEEPDDDDDRSA
jgi:hypothetical protein